MDDYADALVGLDGVYVDLFITPMGFTPAGDLSIRYNDPETYASINLLIPLASGGEADYADKRHLRRAAGRIQRLSRICRL